ncbi:MAG TPA: hydrogenase maturation protease [Thermoanaerobaculaceae bacterium]|nr:hydrogenase maturation protease [Thermoanaerobaculaceae bacterium]
MEREGGIAVVGLGNVLMGDDALGPTVIRILEAGFDFAPAVTVLDLGTPGLDLTPYLSGRDSVIIVDTVNATGQPGEVRTYQREELLAHAPLPRVSPHDPGLKEALLTLEFAQDAPGEVLLVGVIPFSVDRGTHLSAPATAAIPEVVASVLDELSRLGVPAIRKLAPPEPDLWWR